MNKLALFRLWLFVCSGTASATSCHDCQNSDLRDQASMLQNRMTSIQFQNKCQNPDESQYTVEEASSGLFAGPTFTGLIGFHVARIKCTGTERIDKWMKCDPLGSGDWVSVTNAKDKSPPNCDAKLLACNNLDKSRYSVTPVVFPGFGRSRGAALDLLFEIRCLHPTTTTTDPIHSVHMTRLVLCQSTIRESQLPICQIPTTEAPATTTKVAEIEDGPAPATTTNSAEVEDGQAPAATTKAAEVEDGQAPAATTTAAQVEDGPAISNGGDDNENGISGDDISGGGVSGGGVSGGDVSGGDQF